MYLLIEQVVLQLKKEQVIFLSEIFTCIFKGNRKKIFSMSYHLHYVDTSKSVCIQPDTAPIQPDTYPVSIPRFFDSKKRK